MKSDIIIIDNRENGFAEALAETQKAAAYRGLGSRDALYLQLMTEEMLCLIHSVTHEVKASFWVEIEGRALELHMTTQTVMDREKRELLLSAASSGRNEAAKGFLGKLRNVFEEAMTAEPSMPADDIPYDVLVDLANRDISDPEWDGYERSVLKKLADNIKIAIRGSTVEMTVSKKITE